MDDKCKHEDAKIVGQIEPKEWQKCIKCGTQLVVSEIDIWGIFYEVGGFCDNKQCERYLLLVV